MRIARLCQSQRPPIRLAKVMNFPLFDDESQLGLFSFFAVPLGFRGLFDGERALNDEEDQKCALNCCSYCNGLGSFFVLSEMEH